MKKQNFWSRRGVRLFGSLALASVVLGQLPLGALLGSPALGQAVAGYPDEEPEEGGDFLGINGLSNRDVAQAGVIGLAIFGIVTAIRGGAGDASATGGGTSTPGAPVTPAALPDPLVTGDEKKPIWDTLRDDPEKRFAGFTDVTEKNEVKETPLRDLQNAPYTCFAPTDAAVSALPPADAALLSDAAANKTENQKLLLRHVVFGKYNVRDLEKLDAGFPLATAAGDTLTVSKNPDGTVNVNNIPVLREDIKASNGVSHPVGTVVR
jgi:hypothetical protein